MKENACSTRYKWWLQNYSKETLNTDPFCLSLTVAGILIEFVCLHYVAYYCFHVPAIFR